MISLLITSRNMVSFLICSMVSDLLMVVSYRLCRTFNRSGLLKLWNLIYARLSIWFGIPVFFTDSNLMPFHFGYIALFPLFSLIDGFRWSRMGFQHKSIQSLLEFPKVPFLVLRFSYYTLMTLLMILLSTLRVIRHLICGNN